MTWSFRDAWGNEYANVAPERLVAAVRGVDQHLLRGAHNESVITWRDASTLTMHLTDDGQFMVIHTDPTGVSLTGMADGDPDDLIGIIVYSRERIEQEKRTYPASHFIAPLFASVAVERFLHDGGRDPTLDWRPGHAPR